MKEFDPDFDYINNITLADDRCEECGEDYDFCECEEED